MIKSKAKLELDLRDLRAVVEHAVSSKDTSILRVAELDKEIQTKQRILDKDVLPAYTKVAATEAELTQELQALERRRGYVLLDTHLFWSASSC